MNLYTGVIVPTNQRAAVWSVNDYNRRKAFCSVYIDTDGEIICSWIINVLSEGLPTEATFTTRWRAFRISGRLCGPTSPARWVSPTPPNSAPPVFLISLSPSWPQVTMRGRGVKANAVAICRKLSLGCCCAAAVLSLCCRPWVVVRGGKAACGPASGLIGSPRPASPLLSSDAIDLALGDPGGLGQRFSDLLGADPRPGERPPAAATSPSPRLSARRSPEHHDGELTQRLPQLERGGDLGCGASQNLLMQLGQLPANRHLALRLQDFGQRGQGDADAMRGFIQHPGIRLGAQARQGLTAFDGLAWR